MADSAGDTISAPGVCFMIPPPDPEAIALAEQYVSPASGRTGPLPLRPLPSPAPGPATGAEPCLAPRGSCPNSHSEALPSGSLRLPPEGIPAPCCLPAAWQRGAGSFTSPPLWGAIGAGGAAQPSLSRQVPAWLPLPCSNGDAALPQHGVKVLFPPPASWLPRGSSSRNPSRAGAPSSRDGDGVMERLRV